MMAVAGALARCGGSQDSAPKESGAPTAGAEAPPAAAGTTGAASGTGGEDMATLMAKADIARGKTLFLQCRACHSLNAANEPGKIGPTLHGVIGRAAGAIAGYAYSDAVAKSGLTWSAENISEWLARPSDFLPGNKMVFIGIKDAQDRANVIAYIQAESAKPQ
jgi:cytochrome c